MHTRPNCQLWVRAEDTFIFSEIRREDMSFPGIFFRFSQGSDSFLKLHMNFNIFPLSCKTFHWGLYWSWTLRNMDILIRIPLTCEPRSYVEQNNDARNKSTLLQPAVSKTPKPCPRASVSKNGARSVPISQLCPHTPKTGSLQTAHIFKCKARNYDISRRKHWLRNKGLNIFVGWEAKCAAHTRQTGKGDYIKPKQLHSKAKAQQSKRTAYRQMNTCKPFFWQRMGMLIMSGTPKCCKDTSMQLTNVQRFE